MSNIRVLDERTINKIAAGEVVERPASVIKELVENSIDAKATRIEVEIMLGGTSFMRVTDNGIGMDKEDTQAALMRHATSKLRSVDDLINLSTLGFRGEALPTIASVSRFSLITRKKDAELGVKVTVVGDKENFSEIGCSLGTTIKAEDLFFNTPARKKFLKTNSTEAGRIGDYLTKLALSRPDIAFRFISGGKLVMSTPGNGSLKDAISSIYGADTADALLPLKYTDGDINVAGFVSKPSCIRSSRAWQSFIVNGRIIKNYGIMRAIDNAYRALIPKIGYPFAAVILSVPQNTIDINVHPQKTEIKFDDEGRVFQAVCRAVQEALQTAQKDLTAVAAHTARRAEFVGERGNLPAAEKFLPNEHTTVLPLPDITAPPATEAAKENGNADATLAADDLFPPATIDKERFKSGVFPIGQVNKCYIVAKDLTGLYLIDQHAAHERILFDKFSAAANDIPAQQLLVHILMEFDERDSRLIEQNLPLFHKLGFSLLASDNFEFRLTEVPVDIKAADADDIIREILAALHDMHEITPRDIRQTTLATMACRAAIKAGEELNIRQMQLLLEELSQTQSPFTCPHGRPTVLKFTNDDLAKMFKRTGF